MSSLTSAQGRRLDVEAPISAVHWLGEKAAFCDGDGRVTLLGFDGGAIGFEAHAGAVLCASIHPDGKRLVTGGDDGKLKAVSPDGEIAELAHFPRKWVEHVAASAASGVIVAGVGKDAVVLQKDVEAHRFTHASSVGGLALEAKGRRLAVSHYGGVTLRYALTPDDKGVALKWAGSHLNCTLSPDASYVVSAMQENELHGWRLPEKTDLRMSGYAVKTRALSWDKRGRWLATSGADCLVVWPFVGKLGPQGKTPLTIGPRDAIVSAAAFHPSEEIVAFGFSDGRVFAVRLSDQVIIDVENSAAGTVTALAWSADGMSIAFGCESGWIGIASLTAQ